MHLTFIDVSPVSGKRAKRKVIPNWVTSSKRNVKWQNQEAKMRKQARAALKEKEKEKPSSLTQKSTGVVGHVQSTARLFMAFMLMNSYGTRHKKAKRRRV